ncbi:MAG: ChbG/HpnK family deacetylase [Erysipelotrichaceae bacterium]|nr:ChbG/HpnK family deacetylase [Erysipelotrichaceae bacterium]
MKIDIHADDYAYSIHTSRDILDCLSADALDSISIISNTADFKECMEMFYQTIPSLKKLPLLSVHLNLCEGDQSSDLLPMSWGKLFLASYGLRRRKMKTILKQEIRKQLLETQEVIDRCTAIAKENNVPTSQKGLRIDSHIHTHPIPIVWDSLLEVIAEEKLEVEYIREPYEPLGVYLKETSLWKTYRPVNILKNRILAFYSRKINRYNKEHNYEQMYLWGLVMSLHMDFDRIKVLWSAMNEKAEADKRDLELLFHPGHALQEEYSPEKNRKYFEDSNLSKNRIIEKESVLKLKEYR